VLKTPVARVVACCGGMVTFGGAERMTFAVLEELLASGATVHCILNDWASSVIREAADRLGATCSTSSYRELLDRRTRDPRRLWRLGRDLLRTHWDLLRVSLGVRPTHVIVPSHDVVLRNLFTLVGLRASGVRVVMKMSNVPDTAAFHRKLWKRWVNAGVSTFVCNSGFTRSELLACGIRPEKTALVYECLPTRRVVEPRGVPTPGRIVFAGQVIPGKGLHVLLDAVALMLARGADVSLDVVGEMDGWEPPSFAGYRASVRARASQPDLTGRVRFLGWKEDVPAVLSQAALHCCPSLPDLRESFGLVVLEAKSVGVPSVVFRSGALAELVSHGVDGWCCEQPTPESLAEGCLAMLQPDRLAGARDAARRSSETFSRDRFAQSWLQVVAGTGTGIS
jgi:glycosyltransferase involved in cell wall biosynthesis